jgi:hypothetical protein
MDCFICGLLNEAPIVTRCKTLMLGLFVNWKECQRCSVVTYHITICGAVSGMRTGKGSQGTLDRSVFSATESTKTNRWSIQGRGGRKPAENRANYNSGLQPGVCTPGRYAKTSEPGVPSDVFAYPRNHLNLEPALILALTKILPRTEALACQKQAHSSH